MRLYKKMWVENIIAFPRLFFSVVFIKKRLGSEKGHDD
jgi:hypothetical protein